MKTSIAARRNERGASLIIVLIMLVALLSIGSASTMFALFSERSARNDRDRQIAFQAAEAALLDAKSDMIGPNDAVSGTKRVCRFDSKAPAEFISGCGTGASTGMCLDDASPGNAWKAVKGLLLTETGTGNTNKTVQYGQFTGRALASSQYGAGGLPARPPRYVIEPVRYLGTGAKEDAVGSDEYAWLVTAVGFGFRAETQVMLQGLFYKPSNKAGMSC